MQAQFLCLMHALGYYYYIACFPSPNGTKTDAIINFTLDSCSFSF